MADKEIKYRITADDNASQTLKSVSGEQDKLAEGTDRAGEATERVGRASAQTTERLSRLGGVANRVGEAWTGMLGALRGLLGPVMGIGAATVAIQANTRAMEENAAAANALKEAQLDLQFLSQDNNPQELLAVRQASEIVGGSNAQLEVASAFGQLKSQTPHLNEEERLAFFRELTETSLTTSASPTALVELFSKGSLHVSDPDRLQNIMRKAQELSPETSPQKLAQLLPRVLPLGPDMNAEPEQIAGLAVTAMNAAGTPDEGITALRSILLSLQGKGNPEASRIMRRAGAQPGMDVMQQLAALSEAQGAGTLDLGGIETVVGTEGASVLSGLLRGHDTMRSNIQQIVGAGSGDTDLTAEAIRNIYGGDDQQAMRLMIRQAESRTFNVQASDASAQRRAMGAALLEEELRRLESEGDLSPFRRALGMQMYDKLTGIGFSPESAIRGKWGGGGIMPHLGVPDRVIERMNQGPDLDVSGIGEEIVNTSQGTSNSTGTTIHNQVNINEQYNLSNDGRDRLTEDAPEVLD